MGFDGMQCRMFRSSMLIGIGTGFEGFCKFEWRVFMGDLKKRFIWNFRA